MVFLFRDKSIFSIAFVVAIAFLAHIHLFVQPQPMASMGDDGMLSFFLNKYIQPLPSNTLAFVYIILILLQAIRLELLMSELKMFAQEGFTTALAYVLVSSFFTQWCSITPALIANSFVIWIFIQLSKLYNNPNPKSLLFNTGLIAGATVLCYQPTAILILVVIFSVAVIRPFNISEFVVLLLGVLMPFYLIVSLLFLNDKMALLPSFIPDIHPNIPNIPHSIFFWLNLAALLLLLFAGIWIWDPQNDRMVIQIRKNWNVLLVMAFMIIPVPFIFKNAGIESAVLCLVPVASFIANLFLYPKKMLFPNLLFWLALAVALHNNWLLIKN